MPVSMEAFTLTWANAAYIFVALYVLVNIVIISNPNGALTNLRNYLPLVWASSVGFILFFVLCKRVLSPRLHPAYSTLPWMNQQHWNMRLMSSVHAVIVSIGGIAGLCIADVRSDMLESWHPIVGVTVSIFLGYCAFDSYLTLAYHDKALGGGFAIILHHAMVIVIASYPLNSHRFAMISSCYLINELSTPFMNNIHFFRDCGVPKNSAIAMANSFAFMVIYFLCRVVVNTYVLVRLLDPQSAIRTYPAWLLLSGGAFVVAFLLLNLYWFYKILAHAFRLLCRPQKGPGEEYEAVVGVEGLVEEVPETTEFGIEDKESEFSLDEYDMA